MAAASRYLRTLLILGRVSNVPTVWSNCFAGWLLSGGDDWGRFLLLTFGATCLYFGGMFLNDAFDATFDLQHRPERPIPSGAIRVEAVWAWGFGWLGLGVACMFGLWQTTLICALLLAVTILVYDAIHKIFALSPVLMAACRFLLVLMAASAGRHGITGLSIWTALALASYIIGLSFLARKESVAAPVSRWPCLFLAVPLMLSLVVNQGEYLPRAIVLCVAVGLWMLRCLTFALWSSQRNIGRCVSGLLAGIVLVDLLAAWDGTPRTGATFVGLFILALLLQRFAPAT
jgi:4-hydroxybenzoate polyprenyltransferase